MVSRRTGNESWRAMDVDVNQIHVDEGILWSLNNFSKSILHKEGGASLDGSRWSLVTEFSGIIWVAWKK